MNLQLLKSLLDRHTYVIQRLVEQAFHPKDHPIDAFRQFLYAYVDCSFENPKPLIIAVREIGLLNQRPDILKNLQRAMLEVNAVCIEALKREKKMKLLRNIDIELTVLSFSSTVDSYLVNAFMFESEFPFVGMSVMTPEDMKLRLKKHLSLMLDQISFEQ